MAAAVPPGPQTSSMLTLALLLFNNDIKSTLGAASSLPASTTIHRSSDLHFFLQLHAEHAEPTPPVLYSTAGEAHLRMAAAVTFKNPEQRPPHLCTCASQSLPLVDGLPPSCHVLPPHLRRALA